MNVTCWTWLTANESGGRAVCRLANVIGNALRTHTQNRAAIGVSVHSRKHLRFPIFLCSNLLPATQLSLLFFLWKSFTHTRAQKGLALGFWQCGILLQVNSKKRGVWPCHKCEKLTRRNQTGAQTPNPEGIKVCVQRKGVCLCVSVCPSSSSYGWEIVCVVIYILLPFYWIYEHIHKWVVRSGVMPLSDVRMQMGKDGEG